MYNMDNETIKAMPAIYLFFVTLKEPTICCALSIITPKGVTVYNGFMGKIKCVRTL